ncbi:MAG: hypothetical protein R6T96_08620 [Longimicrobiales bacterium]
MPGGTGIRSLFRLLEEMGRRRVWRTALAYAAVCFVLLQLGEILFPVFDAPDWALRVLVVSCFLGFPLVLCLSWVFDLTAQGIRITRSCHGDVGSVGRTLPRLGLLAVTLTVIGGVGWWTVAESIQGTAAEPMVPASEDASLAAISEGAAPTVRSLAVLPLDDFSEEEGGAYFTAGLHEELISQLSRSTTARVVSRTTVAQYDRSGKTMPTVAEELGVDGVVEGSVFRSGDRVRITLQLIHGPSDTHLWAESYEGTTEDAIALQRQVAEAMAEAIQPELFGPEESAAGSRMASTARAREEYLKGRYDQFKGTPEGLRSALRHFRNALEDDSSFAPAHAGMAGAQFLLGFHSDPEDEREEEPEEGAVQSLERALSLDERSPEAQAVLIHMREAMSELGEIRVSGKIAVALDSGTVLEPSVAMEASEFGDLLQRVAPQAWRNADLEAQRPAGEAVSSLEMARASIALGQTQETYRYLEQALAEKDRGLLTLWTDPVWDSLRREARFGKILATLRNLRGHRPTPLPELP